MTDKDPDPWGQGWWFRGAKTRYHTYFYPRNNWPGVLLFALITLLGAAALAVAIVHVMRLHALVRPDAVLGGVGLLMLGVGISQGLRLWREM